MSASVNDGTLMDAVSVGGIDEMIIALLAGGKAGLNTPLPAHGNGCSLHVAVSCGAEAAANALMVAGADIDAVDDQKRSPLHLAVKLGHHGLVRDLLMQGALPDVRDIRGDAPLHLAVERGHKQSVSVLLAGGADRDLLDAQTRTPLFRAAECGNLEAAERLVAAGADVNHRGHSLALSVLDVAAKNSQLDMVRLLISHGADVTATDDHRRTVLFFAAAGSVYCDDNASVIRYLIDAGADTEATSLGGLTALLYVLKLCGPPSLRNIMALLLGGAGLNARDSGCTTALHYASGNSNVDVVELLLLCGADDTVIASPRSLIMMTAGDNDSKAIDWVGLENNGNDADNDRIRRILALTPADRSWRRRGWLVLCRSCPDRVSLTCSSGPTTVSGKGRGQDDGVAKSARANMEGDSSVEREEGWSEGARDDSMAGLRSVVARVVGLEVDGIFRKVVGYL